MLADPLFILFFFGKRHIFAYYVYTVLLFLISELNSCFCHHMPPFSSLEYHEYHRRIVWHMQSWSWSDRGRSPQPPPALTPPPPAQTLCTLRSSSRRNSCKHSSSGHMDVLVPPGEGRDSVFQTELSGIQRTIFMNYQYGILHLISGCKYATTVGKWDEGFVFPQSGSIPAQQLLGLMIQLFCLLASPVCEPDVYKECSNC